MILFRNAGELRINGAKAVITVYTDGVKLRAVFEGIGGYSTSVTYGGETVTVSVSSGSYAEAEFDYSANTKSLTVSGTVKYRGTTYTDYTFEWAGTCESPEAGVSMNITPPAAETLCTVSWLLTVPDGYSAEVISLEYHRNGMTSAVIDDYTSASSYTFTPGGAGTVLYFRIFAVLYAGERENIISVSEFTIPERTVTFENAPPSPYCLNYAEPIAGGRLRVSWTAAAEGAEYENRLTRQLDGGSWEDVYTGTSSTFSDSIPEETGSVRYRVRTQYARRTGYSTWNYGKTKNAVASGVYVGSHRARAVYAGGKRVRMIKI